jgi:hypothetical protein
LVTRRVSTKGFQVASCISSSFPKLSWRRVGPFRVLHFHPKLTASGCRIRCHIFLD